MKKTKRFLLVLLALFSMTLSGCVNAAPTSTNNYSQFIENEEQQKIFALYKAAGGEMTYDEWLNSIRGADGSSILYGMIDPEVSQGKNGDVFINASSWDVFIKNGNAWSKIGNVMGQQGPKGDKGDTGAQGPAGADGKDGKDGIDGKDGAQGPAGQDGKDGTNGKDGRDGADGKDGLTPYIGSNGNWWIGDTDTGVAAQGPAGQNGTNGTNGTNGHDGTNGRDGIDGKDGTNGQDGRDGIDGKDGVSIINTYINENGDLIIEYSNGLSQNAGHVCQESIPEQYSVNFYVNDNLYKTILVDKGSLIEKPADPIESCKKFTGWFDENDDKWVFNTFTVNKDIDLFAKYESAHIFNKQVTYLDEYCVVKETCETSGVYYYSCECGECGTETFEVAPRGHHFSNGWCNRCNTNICDLFEYKLGMENLKENYDNSYASYYYFVYQHLWDAYLNKPTTLNNVNMEILSGLSFEDAATIACKVIVDNPLFFFVNQSFTYDSENNRLIIEVPEEYQSLNSRTTIQNEIESYLSELPISYAESKIDTLTKIHDLIIDSVDYEYDSEGNPSTEPHAHNIVGVVESTGAVCEGYAKAFQYLCTIYNINCYVVTGTTPWGENHAWNIVEMDGEWYWCDLTWDDLEFYPLLDWSSRKGEEFFTQRYRYFLVNDKPFCDYHNIGTEISSTQLPFVYKLPDRAKKNYFDTHERHQYGTFEEDNIYYQKVDNYLVSVVYIDKEGDVEIPSKVMHESCTYDVVSIGMYYTGDALLPSTLMSFNNQSIVSVGPDVRSIYIPSTIKTIYERSLTSLAGIQLKVESYYQNHLENIFVDGNNTNFCSVDGVLYTKDKKVLVAYPFEKTDELFVVDEETVLFGSNAFSGFSNIKELRLNAKFADATLFDTLCGFLGSNGGILTIDDNNPLFYVYDGLIYSTYDVINFGPNAGENYTSTLVGVSDTNQLSYTLLGSFSKDGINYVVKNFSIWGFQYVDSNGIFHGIQGSLFRLMNRATNFNVQNDIFKFKDGCLTYADNIIYLSPEVKDYVIDAELFTSLPAYSFHDYNNLETVTIPEGITAILQGAFYDCDGLVSVTIPTSVTEISHYPFALCENMRDIYYNGTKEQWLSITKNSDWNSWIESVIIHCTDGELIAGEC